MPYAQVTTVLQSLRIDAQDGSDTITVESLSDDYAASLILYGNRLQRNDPMYPLMPEDDPFPDSVRFSGNINLGYLEVFADHISVDAGVHIDTGDENIFFKSSVIGVATFENLLPVFATLRSVSVDIGAGAVLEGGGITFSLQAADKSFADVIGASQEVSNFVIDPLTGLLEGALAMPVKVLVKQSSASIILHDGAQLLSGGNVGLFATAAANASGAASSSLISIGYGQATTSATIDIQPGVVIEAAKRVVVAASSSATANISSSTTRELDSTPNPGSSQIALAIGVAYADVTSTVTVAEGASITAGKTANVSAGGAINAAASGEAGLFADGAAGLAFGIEISKADVHTTVNGNVTSLMEEGSVEKIEIDPLVGLESNGDPKVGYVDYANNRIFVGDTALGSGSSITYTNRRGNSIGGLVDTRPYVIVADEPGYIRAGRKFD